MTARLMDLIVRYHELPKGESVTKRDEIARELAKLPKLKRENFHLVCGRCDATLGGHLGYRCIDDKGMFTLAAPRKEPRNEL